VPRNPRSVSSLHRPLLVAAVLLGVLAVAFPVLARPRRPRVRYEDARTDRPSARYAALGKAACLKELGARKIAFSSAGSARGVLAPVRLSAGALGVTFRTDAPPSERAVSPAEVYDCRLVLALHDWSKVLAARGIDEVRTITAWRPPPSSWPAGKFATRHAGGLAVDVKRFGKKLAAGSKDGAAPSPSEAAKRWIRVEADFHGRIGAPVCGPAADRTPLPPAAKELRALVCEAKRLGIFTSILTPNYDRAHKDHLHVEIRPGAGWSLLL
jgi:hypothetical protein